MPRTTCFAVVLASMSWPPPPRQTVTGDGAPAMDAAAAARFAGLALKCLHAISQSYQSHHGRRC